MRKIRCAASTRSSAYVSSAHPRLGSKRAGVIRRMSLTTLEPAAPPKARAPLSDHLKRLESESIEIIREVAAAFDNPVMLYSIGKDSGVMLHLAAKAFYPATPPFP